MGYIVSSPTIYNVTLTNANTEYSQAIPNGTRRFSISIQSGADTNNYRVAFVAGKVATPTAPYLKYKCDYEYYEDDIHLVDKTLYIASSNAGDVAQIIVWS